MQTMPWGPSGRPCTQPELGSQLSCVHATKSSQLGAVPGSQRPVPGLHVSSPSHASPFEQFVGVATHVPPEQLSVVHTLLSVHAFRSFGVELQPTNGMKL